mgnify:FL=1
MTYVAVGQVYGGDVEDMLCFCDLISSGDKKPYHATFLEEKLLKKVELWPVNLAWYEVDCLLKKSYKKAVEKHFKLGSVGPLPLPIQFLTYERLLRFRRHGTIVTLDMAYAPALLLVQGYSAEVVQEYASKANLSPVVQIESDNKVLRPSEVVNLQLSLGTVAALLGS